MQALPKLIGATTVVALAVSLHAYSTAQASANPGARALGLADAHPSATHRNAGDAFAVRDVMVDADGSEHVRLDRSYRGLPVFGGDLVVHSRNGKLRGVTQGLRSDARPGLQGRIGADAALEAAALAFGPGYQGAPVVRRVVYARYVAPTLAWEVRLQGEDAAGAPKDRTYYVDAASGSLLFSESNYQHAKAAGGKSGGGGGSEATAPLSPAVGSGRALLNGSVVLSSGTSGSGFVLRDPTRGDSITWNANNAGINFVSTKSSLFTDADNAWGDHTMRDTATVGADVHYAAATAWDYYAQVLGRRGIRNDGAGTIAYVHVQRNWANAMWHNGAMYFGDGDQTFKPLVSLDIVAHEMTHGVTQATAGLAYSGESGGLNEATSDIFGTMAEHFGNNPADLPDYTLGETSSNGAPVRFMYKPSLDGKSPDCYSAAVAGMNPHQASAIGNRFFFLLAEGATPPAGSGLGAADLVCNGNTGLDAIGRDAAQRIWYQALTRYMTSGTTYAMARGATLQAAADLFGAGSRQQHAVAAAWSAAGVN
jgi:Zn-dependent metalloprotease